MVFIDYSYYFYRYYIIGLLVLPVVFYLPRFFENQIVYYSYDMSINCRYELPKIIPCQVMSEDKGKFICRLYIIFYMVVIAIMMLKNYNLDTFYVSEVVEIPPLRCKNPTLEHVSKTHIRFGFGLIQKDFHNVSTKEYPDLSQLALDFAKTLLNLDISRSGNLSETIYTAIKTIKQANYQTRKSILKEVAQYPRNLTNEKSVSEFEHLRSLNCSENKTTLIAGILQFTHVSIESSISIFITL